MARVSDPLVELLAIKLYEHDTLGNGDARWPSPPGFSRDCWAATCEEDREVYRGMARGECDLYGPGEAET
jgi:hypothetical protein